MCVLSCVTWVSSMLCKRCLAYVCVCCAIDVCMLCNRVLIAGLKFLPSTPLIAGLKFLAMLSAVQGIVDFLASTKSSMDEAMWKERDARGAGRLPAAIAAAVHHDSE